MAVRGIGVIMRVDPLEVEERLRESRLPSLRRGRSVRQELLSQGLAGVRGGWVESTEESEGLAEGGVRSEVAGVQGQLMSAEEGGKCPFCGEPSQLGEPPPHCPMAGHQESCALVASEEESASGQVVDPLGRTVAFHVRALRPDEGDGFPEQDDLINSELGQYRLGPMIGRGTMGRVYRAEHLGLKRPCALKVMNPSLVAREPLTVEQFWGEARAVAGLIHPHIVAVHNLGTERNYHYIEMELVENREPFWREVKEEDGGYRREYVPGGVSLTEKVVQEGPLEAATATQMVRQVTLALNAAHRQGLVHRDVKPANILLSATGRRSWPTSAWCGGRRRRRGEGNWRVLRPSWRLSCFWESRRARGPTCMRLG